MRVRSSMKLVIVDARRRCLVCDAEATVSEPEETEVIGAPCRECRAPTERVEILGRRTQAPTANPHAGGPGRMCGMTGVRARAAALSGECRIKIARFAARRRWRRSR